MTDCGEVMLQIAMAGLGDHGPSVQRKFWDAAANARWIMRNAPDAPSGLVPIAAAALDHTIERSLGREILADERAAKARDDALERRARFHVIEGGKK